MKLGKYDHIWQLLKNGDGEKWVEVRVRRPEQIQTIINMVQNTKSRAHRTRVGLGLPGFGKLEIRREPEKLAVYFRLKNAGAML